MTDISPMLLTELEIGKEEAFEKYKSWIWQEKQNGVRAMLHIKNNKITSIRNRSNTPVLYLYPEIQVLEFKGIESAIIDCEICVMVNSRSVFYDGINMRDKKLKTIEHQKQFPITIMAFDILFINGKNIIPTSYKSRYEILRGIEQNDVFKISANIENPKEYWETKIVPENREGFVLKDPMAVYEVGLRSKKYLKLKNYKRANVIVNALEQNPKGVKISGTTKDGLQGEIQWSSCGSENIKVGDSVEVEYLDVVNNKMVQPHKVKGTIVDR